MSGNTSLLAYEAVADEPTNSILSKQQCRAHRNTRQEVKTHAQDQQRLGKKTPLKAGREYQGLDIESLPPEGGKQVGSKESPLLVALPPRLRGTPTVPTKPGVTLSSESWGKNTLQSLGIKAESPLTTTDGKDMLTGEVPTGVMHKMAAELRKSVHFSEGCSLQEERSPSTLFEDKHAFFQDPKGSCLLGSGDSSQQPPHPAEGHKTSPYHTTRDPWLTSNVRQPMQPRIPSFYSQESPEVSEQTLRDAGLGGVSPGFGPTQRQQDGMHPADSSNFQIAPFQQDSAADRQMPTNFYAPTGAHIHQQEVEGGIWSPDLYRSANPSMQLHAPTSTNVANGKAGGGHALQTYDMQLMRLEQQNKKRLLKARQEQDAVCRGRDGQTSTSDAFLPQQHDQQTRLREQPKSVQHFRQQHLQQSNLQQQPEPVLLSTKEQWQWLRGRTQQHFQDLLTSAAQRHGCNPAAVPPSVRLDCLQRAKTIAEEQLPTGYIMKCGQYDRDLDQGLPDYGTQAEPQSRSSPKAEPDTLEYSKIIHSKHTREGRHQSQQHHKMVAGRGEPTMNVYKDMAANAFDQDRERRKRKNLNLFLSLEPGFKVAQDRLLESTEAQSRCLRYPTFCDAVNRLRDQQRRTFDDAMAKERDEKQGDGQGASGFDGNEMGEGEKACEEGLVESKLPDRSSAQHAPTLAPIPMRWNATSIPALSGKILPREPSHTAIRHSSAEGVSMKVGEEKRIEPRKADYISWVAAEAEKLRRQAQQVAADKAEELRKQYEAEAENRAPKSTHAIPEQRPRTWIYRHGAYTFRERAQFIQYRHGYIYLRNLTAGVSLLARHLRCFDTSDIEHVEQLTGLCLHHFKLDGPRLWRLRRGSDAVTVEARFLDFRDGYVSLRATGTEGAGFVYRRIEDFEKGDMAYIGSVRGRDFEMSRAGAGGLEEGGRGEGRVEGRDEGTVQGRDRDGVEVEVKARKEVENKGKMEVGVKDKMEVKVEVEAREEVRDNGKMEVEDKTEAANDTPAPLSYDADMEWDCVESSGEEWTEI